MITRTNATPTILTSGGANMNLVSSAEAMATAMNDAVPTSTTDTNLRVPDYHLPFTGIQVEDALWKIIRLDLNDVGGVKILESSADNPSNIDTLVTGGSYVAYYIQASNFPEEFIGYSPIDVKVTITGDGTIIQTIEAGGNKYQRWSTDGGDTWSKWYVKSTNSGTIDTSGNPSDDPEPDPITVLQATTDEHGADIAHILGNYTYLGTTKAAAAMIAKTFDYDKDNPSA